MSDDGDDGSFVGRLFGMGVVGTASYFGAQALQTTLGMTPSTFVSVAAGGIGMIVGASAGAEFGRKHPESVLLIASGVVAVSSLVVLGSHEAAASYYYQNPAPFMPMY